MAIARSVVTAQGRILVPAKVRRKLGIRPGSVVQWDEVAGQVVLRRAGRYTSEDLHRVLFPKGPPKIRTIETMNAGIRRHVRTRHARG